MFYRLQIAKKWNKLNTYIIISLDFCKVVAHETYRYCKSKNYRKTSF